VPRVIPSYDIDLGTWWAIKPGRFHFFSGIYKKRMHPKKYLIMKHLQKFESFSLSGYFNTEQIQQLKKFGDVLRKIESGEAENSSLRLKLKSDSKISEIELHSIHQSKHHIEIALGTSKSWNWKINKVFATLEMAGDFRDLKPLKGKEVLLRFNMYPGHSSEFIMSVKVAFGSVNLVYDVLDMSLIDEDVME
jgi:hypothetical protein